MPAEAQLVLYNDWFAEKWVQHLSPTEWRGRVSYDFREIPLRQLEAAGCCLDPEVVNGWVERIRSGVAVPPPVAVLTERGTLYLHDGNHRYEALRQLLQDPEMLVRVAVVTPRAGYRFCASNQNGYTTYVLAIDRRSWRTLAQWALVLLLCATAVLLTSHVPGVEHSPFFVFLVISVLVSARMAGWAGGLIASAVNSAAAAYLLLPPLGSLLIANRNHAVQFVLTTLIMMAVGIYSGLAGRTCDLAGRLRQRP